MQPMTLMDILGVRLEVVRIDGPATRAPIVFLHEGLGSVSMWRDWPRQVCSAAGRAGVVYSRRGYGASDPIADVRGVPAGRGATRRGRHGPDYMHLEATEVLPALLAGLGIRAPVLLGHSDGGTIALIHAATHAVSACVVMAPHVMVEPVCVEVIEQSRQAWLASADDPAGLRARLARHHADVDCAFWQWNDVWLSAAFRSFDIREDCARISAPLLAMQGCDDSYGTMAQIDEIARQAPQTRLARLGDCGHSPHKDQPALSLALVAGFLDGLP